MSSDCPRRFLEDSRRCPLILLEVSSGVSSEVWKDFLLVDLLSWGPSTGRVRRRVRRIHAIEGSHHVYPLVSRSPGRLLVVAHRPLPRLSLSPASSFISVGKTLSCVPHQHPARRPQLGLFSLALRTGKSTDRKDTVVLRSAHGESFYISTFAR